MESKKKRREKKRNKKRKLEESNNTKVSDFVNKKPSFQQNKRENPAQKVSGENEGNNKRIQIMEQKKKLPIFPGLFSIFFSNLFWAEIRNSEGKHSQSCQ